jgi:hypothetical protein
VSVLGSATVDSRADRLAAAIGVAGPSGTRPTVGQGRRRRAVG